MFGVTQCALCKLKNKAKNTLKRSYVIAFLSTCPKLLHTYISTHVMKSTFLFWASHETGHTFLQWQRNGDFPIRAFLHEKLFNRWASPQALATIWVCARRCTTAFQSHPKQWQPACRCTPQGLSLVSIQHSDRSLQHITGSCDSVESERRSFLGYIFYIVCFGVAVCVCRSVPVQLCNQAVCRQWQSKHKHHWFLMMWLSGSAHMQTTWIDLNEAEPKRNGFLWFSN